MDEEQALLGRSSRPSLFSSPGPVTDSAVYPDPFKAVEPFGSDGSDTSWEDYHSSCSSCTASSQSSEEDWEEAVTVTGDLLYIVPAKEVDESLRDEGQQDGAPSLEDVPHPPSKSITDKEGKFVRWIRRRESKRLRPRLSLVSGGTAGERSDLNVITVTISNPSLRELGIEIIDAGGKKTVVKAVHSNEPASSHSKIQAGDVLKTFNGEDFTVDSLQNRLATMQTPCQVVLGFQKTKEHPGKNLTGKSNKVKLILDGEGKLEKFLNEIPLCLMVINVGDPHDDDSDLMFSYPTQSKIVAARGAFVTMNHLLPSLVGNECKSCSSEIGEEKFHVIFHTEDNLLLLLVVPDRICRVEEATYLTRDLVRCISFTNQTLQCCFRRDVNIVKKFISAVFARLLSPGSTMVPLSAIEPVHHHLHEFLPEAVWVPLPREAQLQLDDALNELEACDFGSTRNNTTVSNREFIVLGSCLFHQSYLLSSHLPKEDLLDTYSFLRQHGIMNVSRTEGVTRMVLWREVFPSSVNRGLPPASLSSTSYTPPVGRWFLLAVSTGHDILAVILENAGCCIPLPTHPRPSLSLVREAEDTLAHIQGLGLTNLAAQWLACSRRPSTTSTPSSTSRSAPKGMVFRNSCKNQEDNSSQAPSNLSNPSNASNASEYDENAPILGRRAERSGLGVSSCPATSMVAVNKEFSDDSQSDSSDSDSDWGSFKGMSINDINCGLFDNPYLPPNLDELVPSKITSGFQNSLFHFACVDRNEGVVLTCVGDSHEHASGFMIKVTGAFHQIRAQLQHNVRFRSVKDSRGVANNSLSVVKECGILLDPEDGQKMHWVVGRLFFTPKPREVYVCYSEDSPQNMLELAFRIGLGFAG